VTTAEPPGPQTFEFVAAERPKTPVADAYFRQTFRRT
jgi:hypothetical protein